MHLILGIRAPRSLLVHGRVFYAILNPYILSGTSVLYRESEFDKLQLFPYVILLKEKISNTTMFPFRYVNVSLGE